MTPETHKIRRMLTAIVLSAAAALLVVPLAQARDSQVDDWFRNASTTPAQAQPSPKARAQLIRDQALNRLYKQDVTPELSPKARAQLIRDQALNRLYKPDAVVSDHILDVSGRDTVQAPSSTPDLRGDYMFQQYFRDAAKANDHILDVSARDFGTAAPIVPDSASGTDWGEIGVGIGLALGGALLLVVLVAVGFEVRHSRHRLGSV
jgi:hypothetical protein